MDTPILDFVKEYCEKKSVRAHMPGHKGKAFVGLENLDITEFDGADCLFNANGIIKKSRDNASELFGANTFYSTEGSSLCIRAMLFLALKNRKNTVDKPFVLAGRNAHKAFLSAVGLLDIDVKWLYPDEFDSYLSCNITAKTVENALLECESLPIAVYITSPDYLGKITDIKDISKICKKYGVLLLVDNAHGGYLKFLKESLHPIDNGADMCCDSAHKTLPALTGSAYLHLSKDLPKTFSEQAEHALSIFGTTSPSYLILQSLDAVNAYIANGYKEKLYLFSNKLENLKIELLSFGYTLFGDERLKLTVCTKEYGYTGYEFANLLKEKCILVEFYDPDYLVMMFTPESSDDDLEKVKSVMMSTPKKEPIKAQIPPLNKIKDLCSIRQALFAQSETLAIEKCLNRRLADLAINCPPAVPIVVCGEIIDENALNCLKYYGVEKCSVVKE